MKDLKNHEENKNIKPYGHRIILGMEMFLEQYLLFELELLKAISLFEAC